MLSPYNNRKHDIHTMVALSAGVHLSKFEVIASNGHLQISPTHSANISEEKWLLLIDTLEFITDAVCAFDLRPKNLIGIYDNIESYVSPHVDKLRCYIDIELQNLQVDVNYDLPVEIKNRLDEAERGIEQCCKEKGVTREEAKRLQYVQLFVPFYLCQRYREIYFEESEVIEVFQKRNYFDLYFNQIPTDDDFTNAPITLTPEPVASPADESKDLTTNADDSGSFPKSIKMQAAEKVVSFLQNNPEFGKTSTPKIRAKKWLRTNYKELGLVKLDGTINNYAIEEISKVVNPNTSGGAPKTY